MRELSVFCDESGDFGAYDVHSPYFILSLVFHDQSVDLRREIPYLEKAISNAGYDKTTTIHTAPLIRRESEFHNDSLQKRKKLFDALFAFFRHCSIQTRSFVIEKRKFGFGDELSERLAKEMGLFFRDNLDYFQQFDRMIVYYDKGQDEITRTLKIVFSSIFNNVEFRVVSPEDYRLFQVADLTCTLELLYQKRETRSLSNSERVFFKNAKSLKNTYLRHLVEKRF